MDELNINYYRATLYVSAVFAVARCPSDTFRHSIQTAEDIVKLLVGLVAPSL